jgi:hypothetical protein
MTLNFTKSEKETFLLSQGFKKQTVETFYYLDYEEKKSESSSMDILINSEADFIAAKEMAKTNQHNKVAMKYGIDTVFQEQIKKAILQLKIIK